MKTMLFPTWIGETVYKICPKCNDKHDGSCKNCAWEGCIWNGCNVGVGVFPDGSRNTGKLQIVEMKVGDRNLLTVCEYFGTMYYGSREDAEKGLAEYEKIRNIEDKDERINAYLKWKGERLTPVSEVPEATWTLVSNGSGVCSNCNRQDHIDALATNCRYCGAKISMPGRVKK